MGADTDRGDRGRGPAVPAALLAAAGVLAACGLSPAVDDPGTVTRGTAPSPAASAPAAPPAGPAHQARRAASAVVPESPRVLMLPSGAVVPVDVSITDRSGRLTLPEDVDRAGWWNGGARLGDAFGAIVVAAHVDSFDEGVGPIAELLDAHAGDRVRLDSRTLSHAFVVSSTRLVPRASLPRLAPLLSFGGNHRLVLITCGGPYDPAYGGYRDNLVVVAEPREPVRRR